MRADRTAAQVIAGVNRRLWSVPLPEAGVHSITVTAAGTVLVSLTSALVAVRGERLVWTRPAEPFGRTVSLGGGLFGSVEAERLQIRWESDGTLLIEAADAGQVVPVVFAGRLVLRPRRQGIGSIVALNTAGRTIWTFELDEASSEPPAVVGDYLALRDGRRLRFIDDGGREVWLSEPEGHWHPVGPVRGLPSGAAIVQISSPEGNGLLLLDPATRSTTVLPVHLPIGRQLAISAGRLATADWDVRDASRQPVPGLLIVDLRSGAEQNVALPAPLISVAGSADGKFCWAASPNLERWNAYRQFADVDDSLRCAVGVTVPTAGGAVEQSINLWKAPAPVVGPLAIGKHGTVLVPLPGELVALGG